MCVYVCVAISYVRYSRFPIITEYYSTYPASRPLYSVTTTHP